MTSSLSIFIYILKNAKLTRDNIGNKNFEIVFDILLSKNMAKGNNNIALIFIIWNIKKKTLKFGLSKCEYG